MNRLMTRRYKWIGCATLVVMTAAVICCPRPAAADFGMYWDFLTGHGHYEARRLEKKAGVDLAWFYARRLRMVRDNLAFAMRHLKPPKVQALTVVLDDGDPRSLDRLELPSDISVTAPHTVETTRRILKLPPKGLNRDYIAVLRCEGRMIVYLDTDRRMAERGEPFVWLESARSLRAILHRDIRRNPPVSKLTMTIENQYREYMPLLIGNDEMVHHHGVRHPVPDCMKGKLPGIPTVGFHYGGGPKETRERRKIRECPKGEVGRGVYQTVYFLNGRESRRDPEWIGCQDKPDEATSTYVPERRRMTCGDLLGDLHAELAAQKGAGKVDPPIGEFVQFRKSWTYRHVYPKDWLLRDLVLTWQDDWEKPEKNTCHVKWRREEPREERWTEGNCGTRQTRRKITHRITWHHGNTTNGYPAISFPDAGRPGYDRDGWKDTGVTKTCPPPPPRRGGVGCRTVNEEGFRGTICDVRGGSHSGGEKGPHGDAPGLGGNNDGGGGSVGNW